MLHNRWNGTLRNLFALPLVIVIFFAADRAWAAIARDPADGGGFCRSAGSTPRTARPDLGTADSLLGTPDLWSADFHGPDFFPDTERIEGTSVGGLAVFHGELIAVGDFAFAGGVPAGRIARWNGTGWSAWGADLPASGLWFALTEYHDRLVAGARPGRWGEETDSLRVLEWDGAAWKRLGGAMDRVGCRALIAFDGDLIAGGGFRRIGGCAAPGIARWDGARWQAMDGGLEGGAQVGQQCSALAVYNGALYAAGEFAIEGAVVHLIRWNGSAWEAVAAASGDSQGASIAALRVWNGRLVAAGLFTRIGELAAHGVALWDGSSWSLLETNPPDWEHAPLFMAILPWEDGLLVAGGYPGIDASSSAVWMVTPEGWSRVDERGLSRGGVVASAVEWNGAPVIAGHFGGAFRAIGSVARLDHGMWTRLGDAGLGLSSIATALLPLDDGLLAAGWFESAGAADSADGMALFDGEAWRGMPARFRPDFPGDGVTRLTLYKGSIIASGGLTAAGGVPVNDIARWDGAAWSALGPGLDNSVLAVTNWNGKLVAGGWFGKAGELPVAHVAAWDGSRWEALGPGMSGSWNGCVTDLAVYGGDLIAAGRFLYAGGTFTDGIARWDGNAWSPLGTGFSFQQDDSEWSNRLIVWNGLLIAAGRPVGTPGSGSEWLFAWDGFAWRQLDPGRKSVRALGTYRGHLLAAGDFEEGGRFIRGLRVWYNGGWVPIAGAPETVLAMAEYGNRLYVSGFFNKAGGRASAYIGQWDGRFLGLDVPERTLRLGPAILRDREVRLVFSTSSAGPVDLAIHDPAGRRVAVLAGGIRSAGAQVVTWDGTDERGRPVPSGVYFARLRAGGQEATGRIVVIR